MRAGIIFVVTVVQNLVDLGKQDIFVLDAGLNPILEATL
jgi:hypothetical protein